MTNEKLPPKGHAKQTQFCTSAARHRTDGLRLLRSKVNNGSNKRSSEPNSRHKINRSEKREKGVQQNSEKRSESSRRRKQWKLFNG